MTKRKRLAYGGYKRRYRYGYDQRLYDGCDINDEEGYDEDLGIVIAI